MMLRRSLLLFALAVPTFAWSETPDTPERVARLSYVEGEVSFQGAQERATSTLPERPLMPGDRLVTEPGGHAELALGTATIRLDERSELSVVDLDATTVRVELTTGAASVYVHELLEDETFEIVTPNTTITLDEPGEYRADVSANDSTALTVRSGAASAVTAGGLVRIAAGQRVRLDGRDAYARLETPQSTDDFDEWVLERELQLAEAEPPRYTPYEGDEELDQYGEWYEEPRYGRVWMPSHRYDSWSPYRYGSWQRVGFGWSWIDPSPWGFFTFHSGRWAYLRHHNRWCWVPGPRHHRRHSDRGETHPFGQPRSNPRQRVEREDGPRTADRQPSAGDARPIPRRDVDSNDRAGGGTLARGGNRERNPSPPAATPPQQGGGTMRPSRADPPPARSETTSSTPQNKPAFGTRRTP